MFNHRVSLLGYVLSAASAAVFIFGGMIIPVSFDPSGNTPLFAAMGLNFGMLMAISGIMVRGFERVEAAVLSRADLRSERDNL